MADAGQLRQRKPAEPNGSKHEATNGAHDANDEKKRKQQQQQQQVVSAPAPWDLVGQWRRLGSFFFEKDDAAFLAGFRLMWGVIMAYEAWTYMALNWGKMQFSFYSTNCPFQYWGFEWTSAPEDPEAMKLVIWIMLVSGICVALGLLYRLSSLIYFVLFTYIFTLEEGIYLNHYYLVCLVSFLMILLPCNVCYSVDQYLFPKVHSDTCPKWCLVLIKSLLVVVYFYAGVAKFNEDWLRAEPLRKWLVIPYKHFPLLETFIYRESVAYLLSYGGLFYDLLVGPMLLFEATFWPAVAATVFFHVSNKFLFNIGIFPMLMIASTSFFFDPSWPRRVIAWTLDTMGMQTNAIPQRGSWSKTKIRSLTWKEWAITVAILVFLVVMIVLPLRCYTYPGTTAWHEYGHKFSWRMKLRTKQCFADFFVYQPYSTRYQRAFRVPVEKFIPAKFERKMTGRPDMIAQFAHYLSDFFAEEGHRAQVYCYDWCTLNSRPLQALTNGTYDIASYDKWQIPYPWVTDIQPLTKEEIEQYPWNWEWNFNWLRGKDVWGWDMAKLKAFRDFKTRERQYFLNRHARDFFLRLREQGKLTDAEWQHIDLPTEEEVGEQPHFEWNEPPIYV